jgi:hypothetical protein
MQAGLGLFINAGESTNWMSPVPKMHVTVEAAQKACLLFCPSHVVCKTLLARVSTAAGILLSS